MISQQPLFNGISPDRIMIKTENDILTEGINALAAKCCSSMFYTVYVIDAAFFPDRMALLQHLQNVSFLTPNIITLVIDDLPEKINSTTPAPWIIPPNADLSQWRERLRAIVQWEPNVDDVIDTYHRLSTQHFCGPRQQRILRLACEGVSIHEIAAGLNLSKCTVYARLQMSCCFFNQRSIAQLLSYLIRRKELRTVIRVRSPLQKMRSRSWSSPSITNKPAGMHPLPRSY